VSLTGHSDPNPFDDVVLTVKARRDRLDTATAAMAADEVVGWSTANSPRSCGG
jgi:hypothetical protein